MFTPETGRSAGKRSKRPKDFTAIRETLQGIMEGQTEQVERALNQLYQKSPYRYLQMIEKLFNHTLPKPTEKPEQVIRNNTFPKEIIFNVLPPESKSVN
jgi:DNA modification methylase